MARDSGWEAPTTHTSVPALKPLPTLSTRARSMSSGTHSRALPTAMTGLISWEGCLGRPVTLTDGEGHASLACRAGKGSDDTVECVVLVGVRHEHLNASVHTPSLLEDACC